MGPNRTWPLLQHVFPAATFSAPPPEVAFDAQRGAMSAITNPDSRRLFRKYDWVIRMNPDVTIWNFAPIYAQMTERVDALIGECDGRVMTDFTMFRSAAIDHPPVNWTCSHRALPNA